MVAAAFDQRSPERLDELFALRRCRRHASLRVEMIRLAFLAAVRPAAAVPQQAAVVLKSAAEATLSPHRIRLFQSRTYTLYWCVIWQVAQNSVR